MRTWLRDQSLSLFFLAIFFAAVLGQSIAGHSVYNQEQVSHGSEPLSWLSYVFSSHFGEAVLENWESEWLQMALFAIAGIYLFQRGSVESKQPGEYGFESDQKEKIGGFAQQNSPRLAKLADWRTGLYAHSLTIALTSIFLLSWLVQSLTGWTEYNNEQQEHDDAPVSWIRYVTLPDFWEKTLQNWQSEFLALGTMTVFTIYLRQRGSPESKPVGSPHTETGRSH
jgi:uncharacterized protein DUF6766